MGKEDVAMYNAFEQRNVSEDLVDMFLDDCIASSNMCTCGRCRADVRAFALNSFPAHYVVTEMGDAMTRAMSLSNQFQADIITAIMKGILIVRSNPRCGAPPAKDLR